mmetsp:Transcript_6086/g.19336  ORF Transcript_6086/g.19336 Transcript_6086/m.19336 type:complete len:157 (-) Transcript_6086:46-516(-)
MSKAKDESTEAYLPMQDIYYIQGYLYKKTRDGRWQKRWFETTGCFLTYYKSKKMTKLLAALNLPQVGEIKLVTDPAGEDAEDKGKLFSIHLNDRDYLLKAVDAAAAARWVEVLNQLKNNANTNVAEPKDAEGADKAGAEFNKSSRGLRACLPCCFN